MLAVVGVWYFWDAGDKETPDLGPGIHAPNAPLQSSSPYAAVSKKGYLITPLADFRIRARVLSRKDYRFGKEADLSPTDLALGWGRMSDSEVLDNFEITQRGRWYFWRTDNLVIPQQEVIESSANMHLIPADEGVAHQLKQVRVNDVVEIEGQLVRVDDSSGWRWVSSLSRSDTGDGSCELVWVTALYIR
jgi:hypothetical protein